MSLFRRLLFNLWYFHHPPWDGGIVPPEVEEFIRENPPGCALDLGCGTGTSSLALARAGWQVTGVDFSCVAIRIATQKAVNANIEVNFRTLDVLHIPSSLFSPPCNLVLDVGCFHSLGSSEKTVYLDQLSRLLATGGTWLLYGFFKQKGEAGPGLIPEDLLYTRLTLIKHQDGMDRMTRPSAWFWFQKG